MRYFRVVYPIQLFPCYLLYAPTVFPIWTHPVRYLWWYLASIVRVPRCARLVSALRAMTLDLDKNVRRVQAYQFVSLLFFSTHWVGCVFFWLARQRAYDELTWVDQLGELYDVCPTLPRPTLARRLRTRVQGQECRGGRRCCRGCYARGEVPDWLSPAPGSF